VAHEQVMRVGASHLGGTRGGSGRWRCRTQGGRSTGTQPCPRLSSTEHVPGQQAGTSSDMHPAKRSHKTATPLLIRSACFTPAGSASQDTWALCLEVLQDGSPTTRPLHGLTQGPPGACQGPPGASRGFHGLPGGGTGHMFQCTGWLPDTMRTSPSEIQTRGTPGYSTLQPSS